MAAGTEPRPARDRPDGSDRRGSDLATDVPACFLLAALTAVWAWWAWKQGAFFGVVFHPGSIVLYGVAVVLLVAAPWRGDLRLSRWTIAAIAGLLLLALWTLLSVFWTPAPDVAVDDAQRVFLLVAAFGLGLWLAMLLTRRMTLALLPLAAAAGLVGIGTVLTLLIGDDLRSYLESDGTLRFPLGYRNANPAFFVIALWPAITLAAQRGLAWPVRGLMLGTATLALELAILSQSRGSLPAAVAAVVVYLLLAPNRLRAVAWLGLATVPVLVALSQLLDVYTSATDAGKAVLGPLRGAAAAAGLTSLAAVVVGALCARFEPEREPSPDAVRAMNRNVVLGGVAATLAAVVLFAVTVGSPVGWVGDRVSEIREGGSSQGGGSTRFLSDARSKRNDFWRVAWDQARESPLAGNGAGSFQYDYLVERQSDRTPRDAHSIELELLSELGIVGLGLFAVFLIGAAGGAVRSRRLGPSAAALSAAALAGTAYWLVQASIDWFWAFPALTAPLAALLGSAAAAGVFTPEATLRQRTRMLIAAGGVVLAVAAIPPLLSERYTNNAYQSWRTDLDRAYTGLDRAHALNPLSEEPVLAEGAIAREAGDRQRALHAFDRAAENRPEQWVSHYFLAQLLARQDPDRALAELDRAQALNPRAPELRRLRDEIERQQRGG